jgi:hypothetical protein
MKFGPVCSIVIAVCLLVSGNASAAIILSIGPSTGVNSLANNSTGQFINLFAYSDTGALSNVLGISLEVQIVGPGGVFPGPAAPPPGGGITFTGIGIWNGFSPVATGSLTGVNGVAAANDSGGNFLAISGNSLAPSLIGRFNIDTTGVFNQTAQIQVINRSSNNSFVFLGDFSQPAISLNASYEIGNASAVPEPSSVACLAILAAVGGVRRFRKKSLAVAA